MGDWNLQECAVLSLGEHTYTFKVIRVLFEAIGATTVRCDRQH